MITRSRFLRTSPTSCENRPQRLSPAPSFTGACASPRRWRAFQHWAAGLFARDNRIVSDLFAANRRARLQTIAIDFPDPRIAADQSQPEPLDRGRAQQTTSNSAMSLNMETGVEVAQCWPVGQTGTLRPRGKDPERVFERHTRSGASHRYCNSLGHRTKITQAAQRPHFGEKETPVPRRIGTKKESGAALGIGQVPSQSMGSSGCAARGPRCQKPKRQCPAKNAGVTHKAPKAASNPAKATAFDGDDIEERSENTQSAMACSATD